MIGIDDIKDFKDLFLGGFFKRTDSSKFLKKVHNLTALSDEVNRKKKELSTVEYDLLMENKDVAYISLDAFLKFINKGGALDLNDILSSFRHINDLKDTGVSAIEIYAIPMADGHIELCSDVKKCERHKDFRGDPLRISTIKRI